MKENINLAKEIILTGGKAQKLELYGFDKDVRAETILKKFKFFAMGNYPRFFEGKSAKFHDEMVFNYIKVYLGGQNFLNLAFRGSAKTSLAKLFVVFVLLNDRSKYRKYLKVLTRDGKNAKQMVTDIYNLILEAKFLYGDMFEKKGDEKREETMSSFTLFDGRKLTAGTVGQTQRGHVQDAYRPDFILFDDCEDRESITSVAITQNIINKAQEALDGLSRDGNYILLGNYISDQGVVEWFKQKTNVVMVTPIMDDNDKPTWDIYTLEDIEQLKKDSDDYWGEYMCLKPDTLIFTDEGLKEICSLRVGDMVLTHLNRLQKIVKIYESEAEDLIDIKVDGKTTTITKNHPVLALRDKRAIWVKAGELSIKDLILKIPHGKLGAWEQNIIYGQF